MKFQTLNLMRVVRKRASAPTPTNLFPGEVSADKDLEAEAKKNRARCEAVVRRMCTGKLKVDPDLHERWMAKGASRNKLIDLMVESDGNKDG